MKIIPLTQGKVAIVDDCDYEYLNQFKWCHDNGYAVRSVPTGGKKTTELMHRVVLARAGTPFQQVDHIDRNRSNNVRCNLRSSGYRTNAYNAGPQKNNTSGYKGVYWRKDRGMWYSQIMAGGRSIFLGLFKRREEAAEAYNRAALKYHGEFAYLN